MSVLLSCFQERKTKKNHEINKLLSPQVAFQFFIPVIYEPILVAQQLITGFERFTL